MSIRFRLWPGLPAELDDPIPTPAPAPPALALPPPARAVDEKDCLCFFLDDATASQFPSAARFFPASGAHSAVAVLPVL